MQPMPSAHGIARRRRANPDTWLGLEEGRRGDLGRETRPFAKSWFLQRETCASERATRAKAAPGVSRHKQGGPRQRRASLSTGRVSLLDARWSRGGGIRAIFLSIKLSVKPRRDSSRPSFWAAPALPQCTGKSTQAVPLCPFAPLPLPPPGTSSPPYTASPRGGSRAMRLHQWLAELGGSPLAHQTACQTPRKWRCSEKKPAPPLQHTKQPCLCPPSSAKGQHPPVHRMSQRQSLLSKNPLPPQGFTAPWWGCDGPGRQDGARAGPASGPAGRRWGADGGRFSGVPAARRAGSRHFGKPGTCRDARRCASGRGCGGWRTG